MLTNPRSLSIRYILYLAITRVHRNCSARKRSAGWKLSRQENEIITTFLTSR